MPQYFGVIDVLQQWTWAKRLERLFKITALGKDAAGISAIEPQAYRYVRDCGRGRVSGAFRSTVAIVIHQN